MSNQLNSLIALPKISKDFLKELLDILGEPAQIYLRVWQDKETVSGMVLKEGFLERAVVCSVGKILELYNEKAYEICKGKRFQKPEKYSIEKLIWSEISGNRLALNVEFTPYRFNLKMNPEKISAMKFHSLINIIEKYRVENNINLMLPMGTKEDAA